jgi:CDP-diacylglycerol--glycerol-3-phosphate 3-phosphatidyltransferase
MSALWEWLTKGYLRLMDPLADALAARGVSPNAITTVGTLGTIAAGVIYASGHISIGGWVLAVFASCDNLDGLVARQARLRAGPSNGDSPS